MNKKLINARREVERLKLQATDANASDVQIWEASNVVSDLETAERESAVRTARAAGRVMDIVLLAVALLTMAFSLQNIHDFAHHHDVQDPIAWFLAPAVDLALLAALMGDAVLSRWQLDAGPWATRLRWFAGAATLGLNTWESVAKGDPASIVLHAVPPTLLFVLAEAASPYRIQFAETVRLAAAGVDETPLSTPEPQQVDTTRQTVAGEVYDQETDPVVSTKTPQVDNPAATWSSESEKAVQWVLSGEGDMPVRSVDAADRPLVDTTGDRLSADDAKAVIEQAWTDGLTVREAAAKATRAPSYVGNVYARLTRERGQEVAAA